MRPLTVIEKIVTFRHLVKICLMIKYFVPRSFIPKFLWNRGNLAAQNSDFSHRYNGEEIDFNFFL